MISRNVLCFSHCDKLLENIPEKYTQLGDEINGQESENPVSGCLALRYGGEKFERFHIYQRDLVSSIWIRYSAD
jgi:hypothetical protein